MHNRNISKFSFQYKYILYKVNFEDYPVIFAIILYFFLSLNNKFYLTKWYLLVFV